MSEKVLLLLLALVFIAVGNSQGEKRDPMLTWHIFPGTKWCGKGSVAKSYHDLGNFWRTDKCCRTHDKHCRARIQSFSKKYGLWNWSWKIASHCDCERSFKTCLRGVNNHASRAVEYTYFKLIKPRCFRFKYEMKCVKRSWFRCIKKKKVRVASFVSLGKALG